MGILQAILQVLLKLVRFLSNLCRLGTCLKERKDKSTEFSSAQDNIQKEDNQDDC